MKAKLWLDPAPSPSPAMPQTKAKSSWSFWGVRLGWGPSSSLLPQPWAGWNWWAAGPRALPNAPCCSCRITIPVQSFSNLQIRGKAVATCGVG